MSNVNQRKQISANPFQRSEFQTVGQNYGERARFQETQKTSPTSPKVDQHRDQFQNQEGEDIQFSPNAKFSRSRRIFSETPHKPRALDNTEKGTYSQASQNGARRPSDPAILNFLDRVIQSSPAKEAEQLQRQAQRVGGSSPAASRLSSVDRSKRSSI